MAEAVASGEASVACPSLASNVPTILVTTPRSYVACVGFPIAVLSVPSKQVIIKDIFFRERYAFLPPSIKNISVNFLVSRETLKIKS